MIIDHLQAIDFNKKLKSWYLKNHRPLLWRQTSDAYKIWLSEIILQQTRVAQGTPYYEKFVLHYPTVFDLAAADEKDVLRLWQGLGYYSRARNMHFTARQIVAQYDGKFPSNATELAKLKGLGNYTAAAIASFAFGEPVPAIDGNVYRVMSRLFGVFTDILSNDGKKEFLNLAKQLVPADDPGIYNQAMIEFGALQCVPVAPDCDACLFNYMCYAYQFKVQDKLPVKAKKASARNRYFNYFVIQQGDKLAMKERQGKDIWKGLYDFPMQETSSLIDTLEKLEENETVLSHLKGGVIREIAKSYLHLLTHQRLNVRFWWIIVPENEIENLSGGLHFYSASEIHDLPKPILIDMMLKEENFL